MSDEQRWRQLGTKVRRQMEAATKEAGASLLPRFNDDDESHIAVGRTLELISEGAGAREAINLFNAWAAATGRFGMSCVAWPVSGGAKS